MLLADAGGALRAPVTVRFLNQGLTTKRYATATIKQSTVDHSLGVHFSQNKDSSDNIMHTKGAE